MNAIQSMTKSLALGDVYYRLTDGDGIFSADGVIGADSSNTIEMINKQIEKKNSEDELPGRRKKSKDSDAEQVSLSQLDTYRSLDITVIGNK